MVASAIKSLRFDKPRGKQRFPGVNIQKGVSDMSNEENKAIVRRWFEEVWNSGNAY